MPPASASSARSARSGSVVRTVRVVVAGVFAGLIVFAGAWGSWGTAQHAMLPKGRERGTLTVTGCLPERCEGSFKPLSPGATARPSVRIERSVVVREGHSYDVVLEPGTDVAVRAGVSGVLLAWLPLGGALLLASVVVAGGMRMPRLAWVLGLAGAALLTAAFVLS
ncbi:hypothetical protein ABTZ78_18365 [Streptomyces bauhiniae]|uniref:hypothetical protein n=1 Tax=Streptomyces bauhiniae TaxID=2340725 RepID=UPI00331AB9B3